MENQVLQLLVPQQHAHHSSTSRHHVSLAVFVDVPYGKTPCIASGEKGRIWRRLETTSTVAKHDPHTISQRTNHIRLTVTICIRDSDTKDAMPKVERRRAGFRKATFAVADQSCQFVLVVMSGHEISLTITIHITDGHKPRLAGTHRKLARSKTTTPFIQ